MAVIKYKDNGVWVPIAGGSSGSVVTSVNSQTGDVVLDAEDVGALPDNTVIPTKTSDLTNDSGFITAKTTLSGYGITDAKIQNGVITLGSNSITPLTSYTETDPTVPSWAKASSKPTYTAAEVNAIPTSAKGAASGVAELDANGLVPTSQLPSYVDDVLEYNAKSSFPTTGETGKIYVDTSTNLTYRWSGSAYVEISPSLALGTTSSTAFRGDYGQSAYTHAVTNKGSAFSSGLYKITTNSEGHVTAATAATASDIPDLSGIYSTTDEKLVVSSAVTDTTYYPILTTNTTSAETKKYDGSFRFIEDDTSARISLGSNGYLNGEIRLFTDTSGKYLNLTPGTLTNTRTISFPDNSGTLALASTTLSGYGITDAYISNGTITLGSNSITPLTSAPVTSVNGQTGAVVLSIPTIPTNISSFTNDAGYITSSALSGYVASNTTERIYVQSTTPSNPSIGDIWIDTSNL